MAFLYPSFLWALAALAIPIIVHLFYFRRFKKVYFSNTKLLKELKEETSSRSRLKNLLVLLMRCLAFVALVLAFAQPYLPTGDKVVNGSKSVSLFIDNSYSMDGALENVPLLELAKQKARDIINAYSGNDQFQILTHEFDGRYQRLISKDDALATLDEIKSGPEVHNLSSILKRQDQVLKGENKVSYLLSDFQRSITDLDAWTDTSLTVKILPVQSSTTRNVSIDSAWFVSPVPIINQNNQLVIKLKNHSDTEAEGIKTSATIDGQEKPVGLSSVPANGETVDTVSISILTPGSKKVVLKIQDYPITFDDEYYLTFNVPENIKILTINQNGSNKYIKALFSGLSYFNLDEQSINQVQYQSFGDYQLIILNDLTTISSGLNSELSQYIRSGGKVLTFLGSNTELNSYNVWLSALGAPTILSKAVKEADVAMVNTQEFIFKDVFETNRSNVKLPQVQQYHLLGVTSLLPVEHIMELRNGLPYLDKFKIGDGQLYVCVSPLSEEQNNLVLNAEIFVPMLYKMALARNIPEELAYKIGSNKIIEINHKAESGGDIVYKIKGESEFIPGQNVNNNKVILNVGTQVKSAGFYEVTLNDKLIKLVAFNLDRKESDLSLTAGKYLASQIATNPALEIVDKDAQKTLSKIVKENSTGIVYWKWCLIAALFFLLLEILLIRFLKT